MVVSWIAGLLTLPAFAYLFANTVEWASGSEGTSGVFGDTFKGWSAIGLTLAVAGGPLLATALITLTSLKVRETSRDDGSVRATIDFLMQRTHLRLAVVSLLLLGATVAYWLSQSWPCLYGSYLTC